MFFNCKTLRFSGKKLNFSTSLILFSVSLICVRRDSFSFSSEATSSSIFIPSANSITLVIDSKPLLDSTDFSGTTVNNALIRSNWSEICLVNSLSRSFLRCADASFDIGSICNTSRSCKIEITDCLFFLKPIMAIFSIGTGLRTIILHLLIKCQ